MTQVFFNQKIKLELKVVNFECWLDLDFQSQIT